MRHDIRLPPSPHSGSGEARKQDATRVTRRPIISRYRRVCLFRGGVPIRRHARSPRGEAPRVKGKLRWHYQVVRHDLWDADIATPLLLYDAQQGGSRRKALAAMRADGYLFLFDRETGKPLFPVEDRKVTQDNSSTPPRRSHSRLAPRACCRTAVTGGTRCRRRSCSTARALPLPP